MVELEEVLAIYYELDRYFALPSKVL